MIVNREDAETSNGVWSASGEYVELFIKLSAEKLLFIPDIESGRYFKS